MTIFNYTHCFSTQSLETIISNYMELHPYCQSLIKVLSSLAVSFEQMQISKRHDQDKEHLVRLPKNNYKVQQLAEQTIQKTNICNVEYIYPLPIIIEVLNSHQFYEGLPKNILVNSLLTTTNIRIIAQTLKIVSQIQSKLVLTTINSLQQKKLTSLINQFVKDCIQTQNQMEVQNNQGQEQQNNIFKSLNFLGNLFEKGLNLFQNKDKSTSQFQINLTQKSKVHISNRVSFIMGMISSKDLYQKQNISQSLMNFITQKSINTFKVIEKTQFKECQYCKNYRSYLSQLTGLCYYDMKQISKLNPQSIKCLRKIKSAVNIFTLYLKQNNTVNIPGSLHALNQVLKNINLVITRQIWQSPIFNPKFCVQKTKQRKRQKVTNLLNQLQPYFKNVYNYSNSKDNEFVLDQIIRMCLLAKTTDKVQKQLVNQFSTQQKMKNQCKDIQTYCIKHQKLNRFHKKSSFNINQEDKQNIKSFSKENSICQINLLKQYQKELQIINTVKAHTKPIHCLINENCLQIQTPIMQEKNANTLKSMKSLFTTVNSSLKDGQSNDLVKNSSKTKQLDKNQLSNDQFKLILYQQYMRKNGFSLKNSLSNSNMSQLHFSNHNFGKNSNQKAQTDYDRKQSEVYNKMQLNGEVILNQILKEVQYGEAVIYPSYQECLKGFYTTQAVKFQREQPLRSQKNKRLQKKQSRISIKIQNFSLSDQQILKKCRFANKDSNKPQLKSKLTKRGSQQTNVIIQHCSKYNQSGIVRNGKYNKNIKSVLRGHEINSQSEEYLKINKKYHYYNAKCCQRSSNRQTVNAKSLLSSIFQQQVSKLNSRNKSFVKTDNFIF